MTFKQLNNVIQEQFTKMCKTGKLFRVNTTGQNVWEMYLLGFSAEQNPIFRDPNSSTYNCNNDKSFIRRYGNVVAIDEEYNLMSIFDVEASGDFIDTIPQLSQYVKSFPIIDVFIESYKFLDQEVNWERVNKKQEVYQLGVQKTFKQYTKEEVNKFGVVNTKDVYEFNHFHVYLPKHFLTFDKSVEAVMGEYRDAKNVFKRGLDEISLDTMNLVNDLINQGSLLNATSYQEKLLKFIEFKKQYNSLNENQKNNWCWVKSYNLPYSKFRNELIGTLCIELTEGEDLNKACLNWNKRADPANYMKASAPITKKQIEEAKKFVEENGYEESFNRRFAKIEDISIEEILHSNNTNTQIKSASIFDSVKPAVSSQHKRQEFDKVQEIGIEDFMKNILPTATSISAFIDNKHQNNLVSLFTANIPNSKPMFKWNNNFSWTYSNNLTGVSQIKENVKSVGGKTTGVLRASLQWNDEDTKGIVDLDLHCKTPFTEVNFRNKRDTKSTAWLDVDMISPKNIGIENITVDDWKINGEYKFYINNYSRHTNFRGFKAEIEVDGNTYNYFVNKSFTGDIEIATVSISKGIISIKHHLPLISENNKEFWNTKAGEFQKVNLVCLSPNFWGDNNVGNKHYFFMLENCKADVALRSFHNEYVNGELLSHRKVLEVLASQTMIKPSDKQLSGIGFNSTVKDELIVKVEGSHKRILKIKF